MVKSTIIAACAAALLSAGSAAGAELNHHRSVNDPYAGYTRADGKSSCCGSRDCMPVPWDDRRGLMLLPSGLWLDPRGHVNANLTRPTIYFSFDAMAHVCLNGPHLVCAFIPGASASAE